MNGRLDKWSIIANRGERCVTKNLEKHFTVMPCTTIHVRLWQNMETVFAFLMYEGMQIAGLHLFKIQW